MIKTNVNSSTSTLYNFQLSTHLIAPNLQPILSQLTFTQVPASRSTRGVPNATNIEIQDISKSAIRLFRPHQIGRRGGSAVPNESNKSADVLASTGFKYLSFHHSSPDAFPGVAQRQEEVLSALFSLDTNANAHPPCKERVADSRTRNSVSRNISCIPFFLLHYIPFA